VTAFPDHSEALSEVHVIETGQVLADAVLNIVARFHWQVAKTVTVAAGQHAYVVRGWSKDDVSEAEFDLFVDAVRTFGRREAWTAPEGFYDDGKRPTYRNHYLYLRTSAGHHAYWYTRTGVSMLNREIVDIQVATPTRTVIEEQTRLETTS
jgi:hypothetical protein